MTHENTADCSCDSCCGIYTRRREQEQEAQDVAQTVTRFLNHANPKDLALAIATDHRTLQSLFMRVAIEFIEHYSQLPDGMYDGRNAAAVELARAITSTAEWKDKKHIPYV
jgi:hypothetical protein